mgnify:CR=1 FL=1
MQRKPRRLRFQIRHQSDSVVLRLDRLARNEVLARDEALGVAAEIDVGPVAIHALDNATHELADAILSGGDGTLASHDPVKSIGSYWPYASTVMDYIRRAMPFGNAQSLTHDELYAITAYVLYLNDIVKSEDFELNQKNFGTIKLPNQPNFYDDDREVTEKAFWKKNPCMTNCAPGEAKVTGRARSIDVTPEAKGPKAE